jgi:DNA-binding GntR family transcriptional regulator
MKHSIEDGPTPLYIQLANQLRQQIVDGEIVSGAALPSEPDLVIAHNVSRTTVRQALGVLADEDIIVKVQGKGTYARPPEVKQDLISLQTISEVLTSSGLVPEVKVLSVDMLLNVSQHVQQQLDFEPGETVVRVKRQHLIDGHPIAYAVIHLSAKFEWQFSVEDLKHQSIYSWLEEQSFTQIDSGKQVIRATGADDDTAKLLCLPTGAPILYVENTSYTEHGVPIEFTEFYFPPDRYSLAISLKRTPRGVALANVQADLNELL